MTKNYTALVVLLAHPDDEFAVFPWIKAALQSGRPVHCVWMTDGGWGGQDIARRRNESVRVLGRMGMDRGNMHFLGEEHELHDGALHSMMEGARRALRALADRLPSGARWLIPAWEGGHQDHDACHLLAVQLVKQADAQLFQYPLYHGHRLIGPLFRVMQPLRSNGPTSTIDITWRQRLGYPLHCLRYRSQWKSFLGLLPFYALRMARTHPFVIQHVDRLAVRHPPHQGTLLYERRGGPTWEQFRALAFAEGSDSARP